MAKKLLFGFAFFLVVFAAGFVSSQDFDSGQVNVEGILDPGVELKVAPWYPKGGDYVFICESSGFEPTSYNWWFGDGEKLINVTERSVFHRYWDAGTYTVMCSATDGEVTAENILTIQVNTSGNITILEQFSAHHNYVFECATDFEAEIIEWDFGDGETAVKNRSSWSSYVEGAFNKYHHTYLNNGTYDVTCEARNGSMVSSGKLTVNVTTPATPEQIRETIHPLYYFSEYKGNNTFEIHCSVYGMPPDKVNSKISLSGSEFIHAPYYHEFPPTTIQFPRSGNYSGYCSAGINDARYSWQYWNLGQLRGCSSQFSMCVHSEGGIGVSVPVEPDPYFHGGIYESQVEGLTYQLECRAAGLESAPKEWSVNGSVILRYGHDQNFINYTFPEPGVYNVRCRTPPGLYTYIFYTRPVNISL